MFKKGDKVIIRELEMGRYFSARSGEMTLNYNKKMLNHAQMKTVFKVERVKEFQYGPMFCLEGLEHIVLSESMLIPLSGSLTNEGLKFLLDKEAHKNV